MRLSHIPLISLAAALLASCSSGFQSARTLAPGKTQVTAGVLNVRNTDDGDETAWLGDIQVRSGLSDQADGGIRLTRTASSGRETISTLLADLKLRLTPSEAETVASIDIPLGVAWAENSGSFDGGTLLTAPTLLLAVPVSPEADIIFGPRVMLIKPNDGDAKVGGGLAVGVRVGDRSQTWAVHPELSITKIEDADTLLYSLGIAVAAGN